MMMTSVELVLIDGGDDEDDGDDVDGDGRDGDDVGGDDDGDDVDGDGGDGGILCLCLQMVGELGPL